MREDVYGQLERDLLPVFLGSTRTAHRLSALLFRRFGTVSLIADRHRTLSDYLDPSSRFLPLPLSGDPRLTAELLSDLTTRQPDALPLLVPCKAEYKTLAEQAAELLECRFIVVDEASLLRRAPIADFL